MCLVERMSPSETVAEFQRIALELYIKGDMAELERIFVELTANAQTWYPDESEWIAQKMSDVLEDIVLAPRLGRPQETSFR